MSYIDSSLSTGEQVLFRAKLHWIIFIVPVTCTMLSLIFLSTRSLLAMLGVLFFVLAVITWLKELAKYYSSEFGLTNKRVLVKEGFIKWHSLEILLHRVEGIQVKQTLLGRLFGYGTIVICGTGGSRDPYDRIANPLYFRKHVQEQLEKLLSPPTAVEQVQA